MSSTEKAEHSEPGSRIHVVGTCGSGKTTVAARLAELLGVRHVELDALFWGPGWRKAAEEDFLAAVGEAVAGDAWIVDGNYSRVRDLVWAHADTVVWLDYSLSRVLAQLTHRTVRRCVRHERLWHGNRERLRTALLSRESILLWAVRTYARRRRDYRDLQRRPDYARLTFIHLRSPAETKTWLENVAHRADARSRFREAGGPSVKQPRWVS